MKNNTIPNSADTALMRKILFSGIFYYWQLLIGNKAKYIMTTNRCHDLAKTDFTLQKRNMNIAQLYSTVSSVHTYISVN